MTVVCAGKTGMLEQYVLTLSPNSLEKLSVTGENCMDN